MRFEVRVGVNVAAIRARDDNITFVRPGNSRDGGGMVAEADDLLPSFDVPDLELFVRAAADDLRGVRVERDAKDLRRVAFEPCQLLFRGEVPHLNQSVAARRSELFPVVGEVQVVDRVVVRAPRAGHSAVGQVENPQQAALPGGAIRRRQLVAPRRESNGSDSPRQPVGPLVLRRE